MQKQRPNDFCQPDQVIKMEFTKDTSIRIQNPSCSAEAVPLFFDSPHSGCKFPDDFNAILSFTRLRRAEDAFVND